LPSLSKRDLVAVPRAIRNLLSLKPGDRVEFVAFPDGSVRLFPANRPITALRGALPKPKRAITIEEMNRDIADAVAEEYRRGLRRKRR
jgi:antitoxin PrlF